MRQEDVLMTLKTGGRMTVPEIVEALALDVSTNTESMVRIRALRRDPDAPETERRDLNRHLR